MCDDSLKIVPPPASGETNCLFLIGARANITHAITRA